MIRRGVTLSSVLFFIGDAGAVPTRKYWGTSLEVHVK